MNNSTNQKTVATVGTILVIFCVAVGYYLLFINVPEPAARQSIPTTALEDAPSNVPGVAKTARASVDTTNWKTYASTSLGFSIKYPSEWTIDATRSDRSQSGSDVVFDTGVPESHESVRVDVSSMSLDEWASQLDKAVITDSRQTSIGGQSALQVATTEFGQSIIGVTHNGKLYVFTTAGAMIDNGMLQTVTFIK